MESNNDSVVIEQIEEEVNTGVSIDMTTDVATEGTQTTEGGLNSVFVNGMNQKAETRRLVQNRYQHQINELNTKIEELNSQLYVKECENKLFKENINTTQIQLQEKSAMIVDLNEQLRVIKEEKTKIDEEWREKYVKLRGELEDMHIKHSELINEHDAVINSNSNNVEVNTSLQSRYDELVKKYDEMMNHFNTKTSERDNLTIQLGKLSQELNLKNDNITSLELNLNLIKQEMETVMNNNIILVKEITEKDTYLKDIASELESLKLDTNNVNTKVNQPVSPVPVQSTPVVQPTKSGKSIVYSKNSKMIKK